MKVLLEILFNNSKINDLLQNQSLNIAHNNKYIARQNAETIEEIQVIVLLFISKLSLLNKGHTYIQHFKDAFAD